MIRTLFCSLVPYTPVTNLGGIGRVRVDAGKHTGPFCVAVGPGCLGCADTSGRTVDGIHMHAGERCWEGFGKLNVLVSQHRHVFNSRGYEDVTGNEIAATATELPAGAIDVARVRGQARDLASTMPEVLAGID
jgi:hypothetical protein